MNFYADFDAKLRAVIGSIDKQYRHTARLSFMATDLDGPRICFQVPQQKPAPDFKKQINPTKGE